MNTILLLFLLLLVFSSCTEKWNEEDKRAFITASTETTSKNWAAT